MHGLVDTAGGLDRAAGDRDRLVAAARASARLRRWLDGCDVAIARALAELDTRSELTLAEVTRTSTRDVAKVAERVETVDTVPALGAALHGGDVSGGHVDVVGAVLRQVEPDVRAVLVANGGWLAGRAKVLSPVELRRELNAEVRALEADGGTARLERQRRAARLRTWVDPEGMWRFDGRFDPETGLRLHTRLLAATQQLFAEEVPAEAPADPIEAKRSSAPEPGSPSSTPPRPATSPARLGVHQHRQPNQHQQRHPHRRRYRHEGSRRQARRQPDRDRATRADRRRRHHRPRPQRPPHHRLGPARRAPRRRAPPLLRRRPRLVRHRAQRRHHSRPRPTRPRPHHPPRQPSQRRALRALYPTCAIPGCDPRYELCKLHHVIWWEHGGCTDLDNLLPLCVRHHHAVHDQGWHLKLTPDRQLTITYPDTTTHTDHPTRRPGPPAAEPATPKMSDGTDRRRSSGCPSYPCCFHTLK